MSSSFHPSSTSTSPSTSSFLFDYCLTKDDAAKALFELSSGKVSDDTLPPPLSSSFGPTISILNPLDLKENAFYVQSPDIYYVSFSSESLGRNDITTLPLLNPKHILHPGTPSNLFCWFLSHFVYDAELISQKTTARKWPLPFVNHLPNSLSLYSSSSLSPEATSSSSLKRIPQLTENYSEYIKRLTSHNIDSVPLISPCYLAELSHSFILGPIVTLEDIKARGIDPFSQCVYDKRSGTPQLRLKMSVYEWRKKCFTKQYIKHTKDSPFLKVLIELFRSGKSLVFLDPDFPLINSLPLSLYDNETTKKFIGPTGIVVSMQSFNYFINYLNSWFSFCFVLALQIIYNKKLQKL